MVDLSSILEKMILALWKNKTDDALVLHKELKQSYENVSALLTAQKNIRWIIFHRMFWFIPEDQRQFFFIMMSRISRSVSRMPLEASLPRLAMEASMSSSTMPSLEVTRVSSNAMSTAL